TTMNDIRALEVTTGTTLRHWIQPNDGGGRLPPYGRGFLAGDLVFWPTHKGLRVLRQEDGEPSDEGYSWLTSDEPLGNLTAGDDCLVVTTAKEIRVYLSAARQLGQRRTEVMLHPKSAGAHYQLAVAATEAGLEADALEHFRQAEQLANPDEHWQGTLLKERARSERHQLLFEQAA